MLTSVFLSWAYFAARAVAVSLPLLHDQRQQRRQEHQRQEHQRQEHQQCAPLTVETTTGIVHGIVDDNEPRVRQFLGIPYAAPPLGDLRFAPPEPAEPWADDFTADTLPLSCPQTFSNGDGTIYSLNVLEFNLQGLNTTAPTSEDCLKLSVWAPNQDKTEGGSSSDSLLPVIIFIYGGGFVVGGTDVPYQIPRQWVARSQQHIVVVFNYRVNIFGFPGARGLDPTEQNLGFLDQRLAIEWVAANIASFGGDPDRMVLWGQSAGAAAVALYGFSYPENPLVKGLIQDSGTEALAAGLPVEEAGPSFSAAAGHLGCGNMTAAEELACMRKVPADMIEQFLLWYSDAHREPVLSFVPVTDEKVVFSNYTERALGGKLARLPAILGTNKDEGAFLPYDPSNATQVAVFNETLKTSFLCPAVAATKIRSLADLATFRYRYAGNFTNISPTTWLGAYHSSELPLIMGTHPNFRGDSTPEEYALSAWMQDTWVAFARDGPAGLEVRGWPQYENSTGQGLIMQLGLGGDVAHTATADWLERAC